MAAMVRLAAMHSSAAINAFDMEAGLGDEPATLKKTPPITATPTAALICSAEFEATRRRGYAMAFDIYEAGTSAMATVVRLSGSEEVIGSVSIAGPTTRMTQERIETMAPALQACADALALASKGSPMFSRR
jgi:DNA-binding IclR family transcriptional regulator